MEVAEASVPVANVFSVIGDSNVQRNLVDYNCANREDMRLAQLIPCTSMSTFAGSLVKIRSDANILIISCLSNFLRDSDSSSDPSSRMTFVLDRFREILFPYCDSNPDLMILVAPPQHSLSPVWYSKSIGLALQLLQSLIFDVSTFPNLHLLPAQVSQVRPLVCFSYFYHCRCYLEPLWFW